MIDHGIFNLKTAHQLFEKLQRDFVHVRVSPEDSDGWFNFFVTADHLADWFCDGNESYAKNMQQSNALLRVVHRLSINAKHYEQKPRRSGTVPISPIAHTHEAQTYRLNTDQSPPKPVEAGKEYWLQLSPSDASELGLENEFISAKNIAFRVVEFWEKHLGVKP